MKSRTAAIVLAGGSSSRLGSPKQLVTYHGRPLLEHVVTEVLGWPVDLVVVVLGAHADEILDQVDFGDATVSINEEWKDGISGSLRVGLDILSRDPHLEQVFVALGDQPAIPRDVPETLLLAAEETERLAILPVYRYERSNPVLFKRALWERLMTLEGDAGAQQLLKAHSDWVHEVRVDHAPPSDVDTSDDVADLSRGRTAGPSGSTGR